jgi:ubiquinone/menaquinone biosynthesis C-methylase UbiE
LIVATIWDLRASLYDVCEASDYRRGPQKTALFREMRGRVLFVGIGTGIDIKHFPTGHSIAAIDISEKMLAKAEKRAQQYLGNLVLCRADAQNLKFPGASFDTVVTSCTMCSVPDREFYRVLRPGGQLLMFEHVRSRNPLLALALDWMTLLTRLTGTEMNRNTVENATSAGFRITHIESAYLDIVLAIRGTKDAPRTNHTRCAAQQGPRGLTPTLAVR